MSKLISNLYKWLPVVLLPIIWYLPRQTAPGGWFENFILLRWLTFMIIPIWFVIQVSIKVYKKKHFKITNIALPIILFFIVLFISSLINKVSFFKTAGTALLYMRYPLLFIVLVNMDLPENILKVFTYLFGGAFINSDSRMLLSVFCFRNYRRPYILDYGALGDI